MALTYLGSASAQQRGVELAETGISIRSLTVRYFPEVNEKRQNNVGETDGRARSSVASREISMEGEVTGATGRMADTFTAAVSTIANDVTDFGSASGGIYLEDVTVSQERAGWRSVSLRYESNPGLA